MKRILPILLLLALCLTAAFAEEATPTPTIRPEPAIGEGETPAVTPTRPPMLTPTPRVDSVIEDSATATVPPTPTPTIRPEPAIGEGGTPAVTPTPTPKANSVIEGGYTAPATPTPQPTPELPPLRDDPMLLNVVEIAHRIDILAESKLFMSAYDYAGLTEAQIEAVAGGDHTRPKAVYHGSGEALIAALFAGVPADQVPDFTRHELLRDLVEDVPEMLWGTRESTELSVLSTLARYKVFALPGAQGCGLFFLLYEDATPILVTWSAYNDAVDVAAFFLPDEALAAVANAQEMTDWFVAVGMPSIPFEEVPLV